MEDKEKLVYDLFCKWGELDANEFKEKLIEDLKFQDALDHLCELGYISMASVTENDTVKVKWVVDKLREKVEANDNSAYRFFNK
jgi:hypothetical protein